MTTKIRYVDELSLESVHSKFKSSLDNVVLEENCKFNLGFSPIEIAIFTYELEIESDSQIVTGSTEF